MAAVTEGVEEAVDRLGGSKTAQKRKDKEGSFDVIAYNPTLIEEYSTSSYLAHIYILQYA